MRIPGQEGVTGEAHGGDNMGQCIPIIYDVEKNLQCYIMVSDSRRWNSGDTTTNQKWAGTEEKRMEKRDGHGRVAEECQCATSAYGGRKVATWCILNNRTLMGHDAEHHDPC
jgi:hypothetical protein